MSYATQADMIEAFGSREVIALSDRDEDGAIDTAVLDEALARAAAEIDAYLAARYTLPLASAPKLLTTYCCDIARWRLSGHGVAVTEDMRARYKDAVKFLEAVRDGKISLGPDGAGAQVADPSAGNPVTLIGAPQRVFSRDRR